MQWESVFTDIGVVTRFSQMTLVGLFSVSLSGASTHGAGFSSGPSVSPSVGLSACRCEKCIVAKWLRRSGCCFG